MQDKEQEFSLGNFFSSLTTFKTTHIIFIVGFIVYFNSLFNGFVWEDTILIINNPWGHTFNIFDPKNVFNHGIQFRPVTALYSAIIYSFFKDIPFFYHFLQIVLHATNTVLLFLVFKHFFTRKLSLILSLIFLIHPINSESVSYFGAFNNPLFFLFGVIAFFLNLKSEISFKRLTIISILLFLSLLAKEAGILFFFIVLTYNFLFKKKLLLPFIFVSVVSSIIYFFIRLIVGISSTKLFLFPISQLTFTERLINIPAIIFYYLKTFFVPIQLATNQQWVVKTIDFKSFYLPLFLDISFFGFIVWIGIYLFKTNAKSFYKFLFFFLWFLVGLVPYIHLIPLTSTVADHWFYLSIVGLLGLIGVAVQAINLRNGIIRMVVVISIVIIMIVLSLITMIRNTNWHDTITLFTHDSKISNNFSIEDHLGIEHSYQRNYGEAINHFKKSVEMFPYEANLSNLAIAYINVGNIHEAEVYFNKVRAIPHDEKALQSLYEQSSEFLLVHNPPDKSKKFTEIALQHYPNNGRIWGDLAVSEYKLSNQKEALVAAEKAKQLLPNQKTEYIYTQISNNQPIDFRQQMRKLVNP